MSEKAELKVGSATYELPMEVGTENEHAINIGALRGESGIITLDPGYKNT